MKKWVSCLIQIIILSIIAVNIILIILTSMTIIPLWVIALITLLTILGYGIERLPRYSTKKFIKYLYVTSFVGIYNGDSEYETYHGYDKKMMQGTNKIEFEILINESKIIKKQKTTQGKNSNDKSTSESILNYFTIDGDIVTLYFNYLQKGVYKNVKQQQQGIEIIEYDIKKKKINSFCYYTPKPSYGEILNITIKND